MTETVLGSKVRTFLAAGLIPLPWFLSWTSVAGFMAPRYSATSQQASELTLLPGMPHALLDVAAIGSGVAFIVSAVGMWLESGRPFAFGALCWLMFGIAMASNGIWMMGSRLHGLYGLGLTTLIAPALSLLESPRLRDLRGAFAVTVFVSFGGVIYLWLNVTGTEPHSLRGLTQRIFSSINSLWPATMAILLLRKR